ncbi:DNA polymerase IV [Methylacidimicrobium sp. AP8]|uniref:DNA polymerase IV n=1 Tax=Methylacidimicrobium sp. AP8 TaxID=2730359 RepID=UPI0018BFE2A4|nr:DNA polymerase IV [Methylacidimicrobium sp. AP8]CAB4244185.1 DNA polymerase IV [Methylacidimicrobium sp. AP8]
MNPARWILHLDLDAFFAAVELLRRPALRNEPVIIAVGHPGDRGVVSTATYPARRFGVRSGMPLRRARALCPQAVVLPARHHLYAAYAKKVRHLLHARFARVEALSIDEACAELPGGADPEAVAREVQEEVECRLELSCTVAVAASKLLAKIACDTVKPHGRIVVPQGTEQAFLAPLPVEKLPGVGPRTQERLLGLGIRTIGDLAIQRRERIIAELGKHGASLWEAAHGNDTSPVQAEWEPKSISRETTFARDLADLAVFQKVLGRFSREVAEEFRREQLLARTITVKLRYGNFETFSRQITLPIATADAEEIAAFAIRLLRAAWRRERPLRLIGLSLCGFVRHWPKPGRDAPESRQA